MNKTECDYDFVVVDYVGNINIKSISSSLGRNRNLLYEIVVYFFLFAVVYYYFLTGSHQGNSKIVV